MAITTLDGLIAGSAPPVSFLKSSQTAEGAGTWHSLFLVAGYPGAGSAPPAYTAGSGYACTNSTVGALPFTNPVSGETRLVKLAVAGSTIGTVILYDRLWTCSGFNTTTTTAQSVTTPGTIPARDDDGTTTGKGVQIWGEIYTAPGATGATWTVSYTNTAGTSGRTATYTHPANAESVGQMFPFTLQAGDIGVQSVQSLTCSVSSGTAGSLGITLLRRIATAPMLVVNIATILDAMALGTPRIFNSSCLALMVQCSTTNTGTVAGEIAWAQG